VDLRDPSQYSDYHIREAINVPGYFVHQNRLSAEMQEFRNRPNCLVILYHDFEKSGIQFINILAERGFENAY
jgi:rhodanese-related sulfurtransferase